MLYRSYALTQRFEGLRLEAYQDSVGVWTIGYGHTKGVKRGDKITHEQAEEFLKQDMQEAIDGVNRLVRVPLTQQQFDALVDFTFNLGVGNLSKSTLLKLLNQGSYAEAGKEFLKWNRAGGKVLAGLTTRRGVEADMFLHA
jgi:lysozyme